jgi:hypothetical protein
MGKRKANNVRRDREGAKEREKKNKGGERERMIG